MLLKKFSHNHGDVLPLLSILPCYQKRICPKISWLTVATRDSCDTRCRQRPLDLNARLVALYGSCVFIIYWHQWSCKGLGRVSPTPRTQSVAVGHTPQLKPPRLLIATLYSHPLHSRRNRPLLESPWKAAILETKGGNSTPLKALMVTLSNLSIRIWYPIGHKNLGDIANNSFNDTTDLCLPLFWFGRIIFNLLFTFLVNDWNLLLGQFLDLSYRPSYRHVNFHALHQEQHG